MRFVSVVSFTFTYICKKKRSLKNACKKYMRHPYTKAHLKLNKHVLCYTKIWYELSIIWYVYFYNIIRVHNLYELCGCKILLWLLLLFCSCFINFMFMHETAVIQKKLLTCTPIFIIKRYMFWNKFSFNFVWNCNYNSRIINLSYKTMFRFFSQSSALVRD